MADPYDFIAQQEGFRPKAYWDNKQWSIGYGTRASGPHEVIDQTEAHRRLREEADKAGSYVDKSFPNLEPHRRAALTSFTYNLGPGWMNGPTRMAAAVRSGDWDAAARIMPEYSNASGQPNAGLLARRQRESAMLSGAAPSANPSGPPAMATYMPQSGVAPVYDGDTPAMVEEKRKRALRMALEAGSVEPLQHWTQALARGPLQGISATMLRNQADEGEKRGNASLTQALMGNGSAQDKMAALARTPWGLPTAMDLAKKPIESDLISGGTSMGKLQLEKLQTELDNAKRNQAIDESMLSEVGFQVPPRTAGAAPVQQQPQMPPQAVPQGAQPPPPAQPRPMPASVPGISVGSAPQGMPGAAPPSPAAPTPQQPPLTGGFIQQILKTRSPAEQKAWVLQFRANKEKAVEKLYEWADPLKKQEDKRQMEVGEAQGKKDAENILPATQTVANITNGLKELMAIPSRYGGDKGVFSSAVGPFAGDMSWQNIVPGTIARGIGSASSYTAKGPNSEAPPAEVRRAIQGAQDTLASVLKPLIRKPGEGAWSDADQARLDMIVGDLKQVKDEAQFARELDNIRQRINANFNMNVPPLVPPSATDVTAQGQKGALGTATNPVPVKSPNQARQLPVGAYIVMPDGEVGRVPPR